MESCLAEFRHLAQGVDPNSAGSDDEMGSLFDEENDDDGSNSVMNGSVMNGSVNNGSVMTGSSQRRLPTNQFIQEMSKSLGLMLERQPVRPSVFSSLPLRHQRQQQSGSIGTSQGQPQGTKQNHHHRMDKKGGDASWKPSHPPSVHHSFDSLFHSNPPQSSNGSLVSSSASMFSGLNDDSSFGSFLTLPPMVSSPGLGANRASLSPGANRASPISGSWAMGEGGNSRVPTRVHTANPLQGRVPSSSTSSKGTRGIRAGTSAETRGGSIDHNPSLSSPSPHPQSRSKGRSHENNNSGTGISASSGTSSGTGTGNGNGNSIGVPSKRDKNLSASSKSISPPSHRIRGALAHATSPSSESIIRSNNSSSNNNNKTGSSVPGDSVPEGSGSDTILTTSKSSPEFAQEEKSVGSSHSMGQGTSFVRVGTTGTPGGRKGRNSPEATSRGNKK